MLWLDLLNADYGLRDGAALAIEMPRALHAHDATAARWFAFASDYERLSPEQWSQLRGAISPNTLDRLRTGLRPLVALYPEAPFAGLWADALPAIEDKDLITIRNAVDRLLDRSSNSATFAQANAIYVGFALDKLVVMKGLALANFPAIEHYPVTEESQKIASSVRASVTMMAGYDEPETRRWPTYFWRRGLEVSPCELRETR